MTEVIYEENWKRVQVFLLRTTIMNYEATERDRSFNAMHLAYTLVDFTNF